MATNLILSITPRMKALYWAKVDVAGPDECWTWNAFRNAGGYGRISCGGAARQATHVALTLDGRPRPGALIALHSCDNPPCCNPRHLRWGSDAENYNDALSRRRRKWATGDASGSRKHPERLLRGERHHQARLTEADVRMILQTPRTHGSGLRLAERFGVWSTLITKIRNGENWKHIQQEVGL